MQAKVTLLARWLARRVGLGLAWGLVLGLVLAAPPAAQAQSSPQEVVRRFVQAVQKQDLDAIFALSTHGAARVEGRSPLEVKRAHDEFAMALSGDPSLCPPESNLLLSCRERAFRGDRVVTDVRLFVPVGSQWEVAGRPAPLPSAGSAQVTVKVTYTPAGGLLRVRDLRGVVSPGAGGRTPIPPIFGDGWITPDNPLLGDLRTRTADYKFFIRYQLHQTRSGELVFQLFKDKEGWLVEQMEFMEERAVLEPPRLVDTSGK